MFSHLPENIITGIVAKCVIDVFETIQIDKHHGYRFLIPASHAKSYGQPVLGKSQTGKVSQQIVGRQILYLLLGLFAFGDVAVVNNYRFNNIIIYQIASHSFERTPASILMTKTQFTIYNRRVCISGQSIEYIG